MRKQSWGMLLYIIFSWEAHWEEFILFLWEWWWGWILQRTTLHREKHGPKSQTAEPPILRKSLGSRRDWGKDPWWLSTSCHHPWKTTPILQTVGQHLLCTRQHMRFSQPPSRVLLLKSLWWQEGGRHASGRDPWLPHPHAPPPTTSCLGTSIFSEDFANVRNANSGLKESDGLTPGFYHVLGEVKPRNHNPSVFKFSCLKQYLFQTLSEKKRQQHE